VGSFVEIFDQKYFVNHMIHYLLQITSYSLN